MLEASISELSTFYRTFFVIVILSGISNGQKNDEKDIRIIAIFDADYTFWMTLRNLSIRKKVTFSVLPINIERNEI